MNIFHKIAFSIIPQNNSEIIQNNCLVSKLFAGRKQLCVERKSSAKAGFFLLNTYNKQVKNMLCS